MNRDVNAGQNMRQIGLRRKRWLAKQRRVPAVQNAAAPNPPNNRLAQLISGFVLAPQEGPPVDDHAPPQSSHNERSPRFHPYRRLPSGPRTGNAQDEAQASPERDELITIHSGRSHGNQHENQETPDISTNGSVSGRTRRTPDSPLRPTTSNRKLP